MKKLIFIGIAIIAFNFGNAQVFSIGSVDIGYAYIGPKIGMHGSWVSNMENNNAESKIYPGYKFGVVGKFGITKSIAIQPELIFERKGTKQNIADDFGGGESKTIANYIGIPILAKLSVFKYKNFQFQASGGVYTNITTSSKTEVIDNAYGESYEFYEEYEPDGSIKSEYFKRVDFGLSFGFGVSYDIGIGIIVGELELTKGASDMYSSSSTFNNREEFSKKNRNTTFGFTGTFLFDLVDIIKK
jgi:hypothetical protein